MEQPPPGVAVLFMGGLGNQMWQVAAAFVIATKLDCPLYLLPGVFCVNTHKTTPEDYAATIFKDFGTCVACTPETLTTTFPRGVWRRFAPPGFAPWDPPPKPGVLLHSYFQWYPALEPLEAILRAKFLTGLTGALAAVRAAFADLDLEDCAFLHVRRGDYVKLQHIHYVQPLQYYAACLQDFAEAASPSCRTVLVVSDDPAWCQDQPMFQNRAPSVFKFVHCGSGMDELSTLALMALCRAGALCANSTFSWWGAFLGAHGKRSPVYIPRRWIATAEALDLAPAGWRQM